MPKLEISVPKLTNRGPAGLLSKLPQQVREAIAAKAPTAAIIRQAEYQIAPALQHLAVPISTLKPDPENARLHPERNMLAIQKSLTEFGQVKPVVVRKANNTVMAGNGTMAAAVALGWEFIAATFVDMTEVEAASFGLADNRTAELAKWDFEVVARLDKLIAAEGGSPAGFSQEELEVLRTDWTTFPGMIEQGEHVEEETPERAPGDAELLMKLKVTIDEPNTQVSYGELYILGQHQLIIADVVNDVALWRGLLEDDMLFAPYPGPLMPLCKSAAEKRILMVQPDAFIAGHILDQYLLVHGEGSVRVAKV